MIWNYTRNKTGRIAHWLSMKRPVARLHYSNQSIALLLDLYTKAIRDKILQMSDKEERNDMAIYATLLP
jgi:hypothetical protein